MEIVTSTNDTLNRKPLFSGRKKRNTHRFDEGFFTIFNFVSSSNLVWLFALFSPSFCLFPFLIEGITPTLLAWWSAVLRSVCSETEAPPVLISTSTIYRGITKFLYTSPPKIELQGLGAWTFSSGFHVFGLV